MPYPNPTLMTSTIAAYSIIGEKNSHTLEPLLATPVRRWQLLAAVLVTWVSGSLFIAELAIVTDANVGSHVVLIPLAIFLTWGAAQLFQCKTILTHWK